MIPREKLLETLKRHWGYERFRPLQLETIEDVFVEIFRSRIL